MVKEKRKNAEGAGDAPARAKKQKQPPVAALKPKSKVLRALDKPTPENQSGGDRSGDEASGGDTPATGRQRGAKNYTNTELKLLISCVKESARIPQGFAGAAKLYNRISDEKGLGHRGEKALSQRWEKLKTMKPSTGNPEADKLHQAALDVTRTIEEESGMKIMNDAAIALHWEDAYRKIVQDDDELAETPPSSIHTGPIGGSSPRKVGSIIDLTGSGDESSQASMDPVVIKQEAADEVVPKKNQKIKGTAKPAGGGLGGKNIVAKTYRHGDGKVAGKATVTEKVLDTLADHLSPDAQEKRDISRLGLFRESRHQDHQDRILEEREKEVQNTIADLKQENNRLRERAVSAETKLSMMPAYPPAMATPSMSIAPNYLGSIHFPTPSPFASDPRYYEVSCAANNDLEPEGVAGPGPQTMHYYQEGAGADDGEVFGDE